MCKRVLFYFEDDNQEDKRPHEAIMACQKWIHGEIRIRKAQEATSKAAISAARAYVKTHALHAANYAIKAIHAASSDMIKNLRGNMNIC